MRTGRHLPTRQLLVKVPGTRKEHLRPGRQVLASLKGWIGARLSPLAADYLVGKVRLVLSRPTTLGDTLAGHKTLSRSHTAAADDQLPPDAVEHYLARGDVTKLKQNLDIPLPPSPGAGRPASS